MTTYHKAGARHSASDQRALQDAHDAIVKAGAMCAPMPAKAISAPLMTVKATGNGKIEGLLVRHTSPSQLDLAGDYFDARTDLGVEDGETLPVLWHHGLDPEIGKAAIGKGVVRRVAAGLWFEAWLNRRNEYEEYMYKLAALGKLGLSSGADPHTVVRVPVPGKARAFYVKSWWIFEGSLTPVPMDPGNRVSIKSLMGGGDRRRALELRARALELELIEIESEQTRADQLLARIAQLKRGA